ncbi:uncharacterized protein LOC116250456 [Nymphaea colorata]|nr:uncharacterized protein LOC116250456 [Nymphaea colorata]
MARRKQAEQDSPEVEGDTSAQEEQPQTELDVHAMEKMVHIENEVLQIRQEMMDYKKELSRLRELDEIKEMIRALSSNQEANPRSTQGPPPPPPPRQDKGKGVLGGQPSADPTPWHMQAGPSRPRPTWQDEHVEELQGHHYGPSRDNGGHNGHHVDHTVNNGGHNGHHGGPYSHTGAYNGQQGGYNGNHGGQQHSSSDYINREPYGPQASRYGPRFAGSQWEHENAGRRWADRVDRDPPIWEQSREREPPRWDNHWEPRNVQRNQPRALQVHIEFPRFNGNDPLDWIFQVEEYFTCQMIPREEWLHTATLHFDGEARRWLRWLKMKEPVETWGEFREALTLRFGESAYVDYDIELRNLRQTSTVQEYQARFENLASMVDWTHKALIAAFVGGLKEEIQIDVRDEPNTELRKCFAKARSIEDRQRKKQALYKSWRNVPVARPQPAQQHKILSAPPKKEEPKPVFRSRAPPPMTRKEREDMIKNKKCFWCKGDWSPTHQCKHIRIYTVLEGDSDEEGKDQPLTMEEVFEAETEVEPTRDEEAPEAECRILDDPERPESMKVLGHIGDRQVLVLLDSGATHNFVGDHIAGQLGCTIEDQPQLRVLVANGDILPCTRKCTNVELTLQKVPFKVDLLVVPIPSVDVILGVKWLKTLGRVWWDFSAMELCLPKEGGKEGVVLRAVEPSLGPRAALRALVTQKSAAWLVAIAEELTSNQDQKEEIPGPVQEVLKEFEDIFEEPKRLPPQRTYDHRIVLTNGTEPVNVRPYRYGYAQKSEIEKLVKEMRESNIIRPSSSPFSSPVLLVKKKDNTWRFCVDYRALNEATVKDRHPIPVIDELLDELSGARVFSKLDLRSGYHQIRMYEEDISKTAFRTHDGHYEFLVMPFGLTNAPATFQRCMNDVFREFLRDFILVFFDDILVYSQSMEQHAKHLRIVLKVLREHTLFAKMSKCSFGQTSVGYLGHIVSYEGVRADPEKLQAMEQWPLPKDPRGMRGFLGLTGYYRRFIKGYGLIASPLTHMLKKGEFTWTDKAREAFVKLKAAMMSAPVLALPDFAKDFVIETDASDVGIGAVLSQEGHPIAFMSKALTSRAKPLSTYEKELLAIVMAVDKWRPYLIGRRFVVRTDHSSLRYMVKQRVSTPTQQRWLAKLLGYDFTIEYKKGTENSAADSLSRMPEQLKTLSVISTDLWERIIEEQNQDSNLRLLKQTIRQNPGSIPNYTLKGEMLCKKKRALVPKDSDLKQELLKHFHNSSAAGHEGVAKTMGRIKAQFWWDGMKSEVRGYVKACPVCQREKYEATKPPGHLNPLPIPDKPWEDVSMDFIDAMPRSEGKEAVLVVVDRLTKYSHFVALPKNYHGPMVAGVYQDHIGKLHGMPQTIVCDRDSIFMSAFWREYMKMAGTVINFSTAHHPQTDGQSEVVNRTLETYLRCFAGERPNTWIKFLSWAEWAYNTSLHSGTGMTPHEALYGYPPTSIPRYEVDTARDDEVDCTLRNRDEILATLKKNIERAQVRMRKAHDKGRKDREFEVGDMVWLKRLPMRQKSLLGQPYSKLLPKYYGPFRVLQKIGKAAYRIALPPPALVHPVFHVSRLKPHHGPVPEQQEPLPDIAPRPYRILKHRWVTRNGRPRHEEGGSDTGQPSNWPQAATDIAESSHRGQGEANFRFARAECRQDGMGLGQDEGNEGVQQLGLSRVEDSTKLGVSTVGGAGGCAMALGEALGDQGGGSSSCPVESSPSLSQT